MISYAICLIVLATSAAATAGVAKNPNQPWNKFKTSSGHSHESHFDHPKSWKQPRKRFWGFSGSDDDSSLSSMNQNGYSK